MILIMNYGDIGRKNVKTQATERRKLNKFYYIMLHKASNLWTYSHNLSNFLLFGIVDRSITVHRSRAKTKNNYQILYKHHYANEVETDARTATPTSRNEIELISFKFRRK